MLLTNGTISLRNEKSIKLQSTFNQLIDRAPSSAVYCSIVLNIAFGFYLIYTNLIDQGCTLPNGLKVPNGWENLYNNCQEKCVCRRNKFQCSASGCDLNYNECTVNSDGEEFCHGALLVLFSGDSITDNYARLIDLNGKIKILNLYQRFIGTFNENLDFRFGKDTSVYNGCGATIMGQLWYFGGIMGDNRSDRQVLNANYKVGSINAQSIIVYNLKTIIYYLTKIYKLPDLISNEN